MREFVQRWWIFGSLPLGILVGWVASTVVPPVIAALFVVAATLIGAGIMQWRIKVWKRQMEEELVEALIRVPVYLTSDLWREAEQLGLISPEAMADIRRRHTEAGTERGRQERAQEEQA